MINIMLILQWEGSPVNHILAARPNGGNRVPSLKNEYFSASKLTEVSALPPVGCFISIAGHSWVVKNISLVLETKLYYVTATPFMGGQVILSAHDELDRSEWHVVSSNYAPPGAYA